MHSVRQIVPLIQQQRRNAINRRNPNKQLSNMRKFGAILGIAMFAFLTDASALKKKKDTRKLKKKSINNQCRKIGEQKVKSAANLASYRDL